jgi:uncharacterized protein (TIGR03790 family)
MCGAFFADNKAGMTMVDKRKMTFMIPTVLPIILPMILAGCSSPIESEQKSKTKSSKPTSESARVMVVVNEASLDSVAIAEYYVKKRGIPAANVVRLRTSVTDEIHPDKFNSEIFQPVKNALGKRIGIDFIVLTKGLPLRLLDNGGYSVDAMLAGMNLKVDPVKQKIGSFGIDEVDEEAAFRRCQSPYYNSKTRFTSKKYSMFLVTRLTGYTVNDAKKLVDNSVSAKPAKGPILLDAQPQFGPGTGYWEMETTLNRAYESLSPQGLEIDYNKSPLFADSKDPLMGYASWGSNDPKFDINVYRSLRFRAGAIAETFVSTSGRTFEKTNVGQSLIADLVAQGVTGVKGYVSEPFTIALCRSDILFDRYFNGFNLAEAFYASSPLIKWKDIVIGDPLCRPFKDGKYK